VVEVELKKVKSSGLNPRVAPDPEKMAELAESIKAVGVLQPVLLRPKGDVFEIVIGERRVEASKRAKQSTIPATIREMSDDQVLEAMLIENIQREDLSDVEKGKTAKMLMEKFPTRYPSHVSLATRVGVDKHTVSRWITIIEEVPPEIQELIAPAEPVTGRIPKGKISGEAAYEITRKVKKKEKAVSLAKEIARRRVTRQVLRKVIKKVAKEPEKPVRAVFKEIIEEAPAVLPFSHEHYRKILDGTKTQTARKALPLGLKEGAKARASVTYFADLEITDVYKKKLGEFDREDAKREGGYTLEEFKEVWKSLHDEWNPDETVNVIRFRVARVI